MASIPLHSWSDPCLTFLTGPRPPPPNPPTPRPPSDLYLLDSAYGTEVELREALRALHDNGLKAIADIVINHRCAHGVGAQWGRFLERDEGGTKAGGHLGKGRGQGLLGTSQQRG